jgi:hypothetical protein
VEVGGTGWEHGQGGHGGGVAGVFRAPTAVILPTAQSAHHLLQGAAQPRRPPLPPHPHTQKPYNRAKWDVQEGARGWGVVCRAVPSM